MLFFLSVGSSESFCKIAGVQGKVSLNSQLEMGALLNLCLSSTCILVVL